MMVTALGRSLARRGAWVVAILALLAVLALSACSHGASTPIVQEATPTATLPPVEQVTQTDASFDAVLSALDAASVDANLDESAKDSVTVP